MKKFKLALSILMVCALLIGVMAGCGQTSDAPKADAAPAKTDAAPAKADAAKSEVKIAMVLKTLANPFWVAMKEGIEAEAKKQNVKVDIFSVDSEDDVQGQLKKVEDALAQKYSALGVAPLTAVNLIPVIVQANKAGLPVVNIDEKVDMKELKNAGGKVWGFVTTDNVKVGEKGGKAIVDKVGEGEVAIIEGKAGNASGADRRDGAKKAFEANSKIKIVASQPADWDRVKALDVATNIMQKNPNLKGFYCCNDTMALGAVEAVKNAGKAGKVFVVGTDGAPEAIAAVKDGSLLATVGQDPGEIGASSLRILIDAVNKKIAEPTGDISMTPVDSKLITK